MRGVIFSVLLFLLVAANITTYNQSEPFVIDNTEFIITHLIEDGASILINDQGRILRIDECHRTSQNDVCLESVTNISADVSITLINRSYTVTRTIPDTVDLGEIFRVEIHIENHAPERRTFSLQDSTPVRTQRHSIINKDLFWTGTIAAYGSQILSYQAIADTETTFMLEVTEPYPKQRNHSVEVEDFISVEVEYTNETTRGATYPFELSIDSEQQAELFVVITPPEDVRITNRQNLTMSLTGTALSNETPYFAFDYEALEGAEGEFVVRIAAETNESDTERTYRYSMRDGGFSPITIIHDYEDARLQAQTLHDLTLTFLNPNERAVPVTLRAQSVLLDIEEDFTIPAQETLARTYEIFPNVTGSEYTIQLTLTYDDDNDAQVRSTESLRITSVNTPPEPEPDTTNDTNITNTTPSAPTPSISVQEAANNSITITANNFLDEQARLSITRDTELVYDQDIFLNESHTTTLTANGTYIITLSGQNVTAETTYVLGTLPEPEPEPTQPEEAPKGFDVFMIMIAAAGLLFIAFIAIIVRVHFVKKRFESLVQSYEHTQQFLSNFVAHSPQDLALEKQLREELSRIESIISEHKH